MYPIPKESALLVQKAVKVTVLYEFEDGATAVEIIKDRTGKKDDEDQDGE